MQPYAHHFGSGFALRIEQIEGISQIGKKLVARVKPLSRSKSHIVVVERVWNHQMRLAVVIVPVGEIIGVAIGVIEKPTLLDHKLSGMNTGASGVPA